MRRGAAKEKILDRRSVLRPSRHWTKEEQLVQCELSLKNVPLAQPPLAFQIERSDHLSVPNQRLEVRRVLGDGVDDGVAESLALRIPGARAEVIRRVLHEARHHVLAGGGHRWVRQARDDDVDVRPRRESPVLRVVVGALHVVQAGRDRDRAPKWRPPPGRLVKSGKPSSARLTFPDEPRNLYRRTSSTNSSGGRGRR